jgi:hypothetical protein
MPKPAQHRPERPISVQLPLFAEAASLARIRPERNEWRFYRMEVSQRPLRDVASQFARAAAGLLEADTSRRMAVS